MKGILSTHNNWELRGLTMREYGYNSDANEGKKTQNEPNVVRLQK